MARQAREFLEHILVSAPDLRYTATDAQMHFGGQLMLQSSQLPRLE